jgi:hypothetical protein
VRIKSRYILLLIIILALLITGCSRSKNTPIITIEYTETSSSDSSEVVKLYKKDMLYEIWKVEKEGDRLEDYYQKNLGLSYWDYEYNNTSMRKLAKSSVLASVVMHEILFDQASRNHITLTDEDKKANQTALEGIYADTSERSLDKVGLTKDVITKATDKIALADKYKNELCKDLDIDEEAITKSIDRKDYSSEDRYEQAVKHAITSETNLKFEPIYKRLKEKYEISVDFDYWDSLNLGSITIPN